MDPNYASLETLQATGRFYHLTETSYTLQDLTANSYYQVWVRHRNANETGDWSSPLDFTTVPQCAQPQNPQVVTTQTTATITWEAGQANQTSWYIFIDGYSGHDMGGEDIDTTSFTMTDLTPGSEFRAEIRGYCTGDDGTSDPIYLEFSTDDYDHLTVNEGTDYNEFVVIIGDECGKNGYYGNSRSQFIIPAEMLTEMQYSTIQRISFYSGQSGQPWGSSASFLVYMKEVDFFDFDEEGLCGDSFVDWNDLYQFNNTTLRIENGKMTIESGSGFGFHYTNGNLLIGIKQNWVGNNCQVAWYGVGTSPIKSALYEPSSYYPQCVEFLPKTTFAYESDPYNPPTEFMAYATGSNEVYFNWTPCEGVTTYEIEVSESLDFDEIYDQHLVGLTGYEYTWIDSVLLGPDNTYYARIRALYESYGVVYGSSWSEGVEFETQPPCPAPTNLTAVVTGNLTVELDWTENGDAEEWVIAFAPEGENEQGMATYQHPYTLTAPYLEPGKAYTVRVRPICQGESFSWSNTATFNTNNIVFADTIVKQICVANWDGILDNVQDGELSFAEAAEVTNLGEVFKNNDNIHSFDELQYFTGLTSIVENAFGGCDSLTSVIIPNGVTTIGNYAFGYCPNLTSVIIPNGVTTIGNYAFMNDSRLTNIDFPESLRIIGSQAFDHCTSLIYLFIPASVISITSHAFLGCSGLEYVSVAPGNIIYDSRNNCNAIIATRTNQLRIGCKTTMIPNTVTSIGPNAFRANTALTSIDLPESISTINGAAFYGCSSLLNITLPASLDSIGDRVFCNCTGLRFITVEATNPPKILTGTQDSFYGVDKTIPVYVPCEAFSAYRAATGWSEFTNIFGEGCEQTITLNAGWNWWAPTIETGLGELEMNLGGRGILILSQDEGFARYQNSWSGTLDSIALGKMYKIQLTEGEPLLFVIEGSLSDVGTVTIKQGFNWFGYTGTDGLTIAEALGSFVPVDEDEIIDEDGHSAYYDGESWSGDLTLVPGKGYLYVSHDSEDKTLTFE